MPDILDVLSLAEAKLILDIGLTDTTQDDNLARAITAVSRRFDTNLVGPVVVRTITDEAHDGGTCSIELEHGPATAITAVSEWDTAGVELELTEETHDTKPADAWLGEKYSPDRSLYSGVIDRRANGITAYNFASGRNNVLVTYEAGRFATTAAVDARFKEAAGLTLRNLWRAYQESVGQVGEFEVPISNFPTFAIPAAVLELLHPELQPEVGFGA